MRQQRIKGFTGFTGLYEIQLSHEKTTTQCHHVMLLPDYTAQHKLYRVN